MRFRRKLRIYIWGQIVKNR